MPHTAAELLALIRARVSRPASVRELLQLLRVPRDGRVAFRRQLVRLVATGALVEVRGRRFDIPDRMDQVVGRIAIHPEGYGFVRPDGPAAGERDVHVAAAGIAEAMHGDRVVARVARNRDGRREGRVVRVLERRQSTVVGRYEAGAAGFGYVSPVDHREGTGVAVARADAGGARPGDMVVAEMTGRPSATRESVGRIVEVLGDLDQPGVDTRVVIRKYGLPDVHRDEAMVETRALTRGAVSPARLSARRRDLIGRTDFRDRLVVTIDGERARDFDDAVSIESLPGGRWRLGVHIADVAHYVREGSALDAEARERGTSVYFPDRALHMFPDALATGLCSLNPGVDRLVQSVLMEVDRDGEVVSEEFHDGVIRCRARMTYAEVNAMLTGREPAATARDEELMPLVASMRALFDRLAGRRRRLGSIDFDLDEAEFVFDEAGAVEAIVASERNVAHRMIEEFMLLANQTVARFLDRRGAPSLFRVHEPPDPIKVRRFEEFLGGLGLSLDAPAGKAEPRHFRALLDRVGGLPEERAVAYLTLRAMQKARYASENLGHFGLAFDSYTHFTSPIRRYPDLVVHRVVRAARRSAGGDAGRQDGAEALAELARQTSQAERRAEEAERELADWKKVRFMAGRIGEEFEGLITGVTVFGFFVQLTEPFVEGLVHLSALAGEEYRFVEAAHELRGVGSRASYRLGGRVRVRVVNVDHGRRRIDLGLVERPSTARREGAIGRGLRRDRRRPAPRPRRPRRR